MEKKNKIILVGTLLAIVVILILMLVLPNALKSHGKVTGTINVSMSLSAQTDNEVEEIITSRLRDEKYRLSNAGVYIDPYGISPLSALITFNTDSNVSVAVTVVGKNNDDIVLNYNEKTKEHIIPVYGLYPDYTNTIIVKLSNGESKTFTIKTDQVRNVPSTSSEMTPVNPEGSLYLITSPLNMNSYGVDAYGEVRWASSNDNFHDIQMLDNGHFLIGCFESNDSGLAKELVEMDFLGKTYKKYVIEEGYLNDFKVLSNGNILVASKKAGRETYSDLILEINGQTGKIVNSVDLYEIFKSIDSTFVSKLDSQFFYNSGIEYYQDTDTLLLTYWGGEFVVSLNYSSKSINYIFSNPKNFTSAFSRYLLTSEDGVYPKGMHSATQVGNTLKVFDNGYATNEQNPSSAHLKGSYSSANTYTINNKNIKLVSSYDADKKYFSYALADYEITKDSEIVLFGRELANLNFDSNININDYDILESHMVELRNGTVVTSLKFEEASYSVTKCKLSGDKQFEFKVLSNYSTLEPTPKEKLTSDIIRDVKETTKTLDYDFGYDDGVLEVNVIFLMQDEEKIVLIDSNNNGAVYAIKEADKKQLKKVIVDLPASKYYIYVLRNGKAYKTNQFIEVK